MNTFLLSFDATTTFSGSNPPTLEILIGGVVVSSVDMENGAGSYNLFLDFTGAVPSSIDFRFAAASGDPSDSINFTAVSINNTSLNLGTDLTATLLMQSQTSGVTAADVFGHTVPTLGVTTVSGTGGDDVDLPGSNTADVIEGLAGNDRIRGRGGDDEINGGDGNDIIFGEDGDDTVIAGAGIDVVYGNDGNDILFGEGDADYLIGGDGDDVLNGGAGNDGLIGDAGDDRMFGEDGDDYLIGDAGNDIMFGDAGNDILVGGADNDVLGGGEGDDQLIGEDGDDIIGGGDGADEIVAGTGSDIVSGGLGQDNIYGGDGNDEISGGGDGDYILGGDGADDIGGDAGNDMIIGGLGADTISGGAGDDIIHGHGLDAETVSDILRNNVNVVYSADTGSFYQYINTNTNWTAANTAANAATLNGANGHLVTVTSQAENDFVQSLLDGGESIWTSGSDNGAGQTWVWNAGAEAGTQFWSGQSGGSSVNGMYENWQAGEPNATNAFVRLQQASGEWTDRPNADNFDYVIEWEAGLFSDDNATDTIDGGSGADYIYGWGGNDDLNGGENDDHIFAGAGNDTAVGGAGDDVVSGGAGNDIIRGDGSGGVTLVEAGRVSVTQANDTQWHTVNFAGTIDNAVIKMFAEDMGAEPFTIRVRNVTSTSFQFQLDEFDYQDGSTVLETLSWVAVASGTHTLDNGIEIQAGYTTATNESVTPVAFNASITSPVVFTQVSSDNDLSAVVVRNDNVTSAGFDLNMQEEEAADGNHVSEDIGWIAVNAGGSVASGILAGTTGDVVNNGNTTVNFGGSFSGTPAFIADMQSLDGGDTSYVASPSTQTSSQAQVFIDEEQSGDTEVNHTNEPVGYLAIETGVYAGQTTVNGSDHLYGGDGDDDIYADVYEDTDILDPFGANPLAGAILADAPDAYWALNETSGTTADNRGTIGTAVDGTVIGATLGASVLYTGGRTSMDFDGVNDGISIPDDAGINTSTYAERTVELVFNADDVVNRQVLFEEGGTTNGLTIYIDGNNVYVTGEDDGDWADANLSAGISVGTTYHVAFVFDQPNNSFEGFLDGVSMGSVTVNNAVFPGHSGDIGIGYAPDGLQFHDGEDGSGGYYFDGRISDVALYNRALSDAEIQEHADIVGGTLPAAGAVDDVLYGGDGFDELFGGEGRDVFVFEAASAFNDVDQINGFDVGEQDAIDLSDILTGFTAGVSDINDFVTVTTSGGNSIVAVDANGTAGGVSFTNIAQINGMTEVSAENLYANNSIIPV